MLDNQNHNNILVFTVKDVLSVNLLKTIEGKIVSLIGIESPSDGEIEAFNFIKEVVLGKKIQVEFDVQRKDANGYLLGNVYVFGFKAGKKSKKECHKNNYLYATFAKDSSKTALDFVEFNEKDNTCSPIGCFEDDLKEMNEFLYLNATLLNCGLAELKLEQVNNRYQSFYKEIYDDAKNNKRGIWKNYKE